jgi:putative flippase GtrA
MKKIIKKIKRRHLTQVFTYGIVGVIALAIQMLIYMLLCRVGLNPLFATIVGASGGIVVAYQGHVKFTFKKAHKFSRSEFIKYVVTAVFGMVFNSVAVYVLVNLLKYHMDIGLIPMLFTPGITFIINKLWSFK